MTEKRTRSSRKSGIRLDAPTPIIQTLHHHHHVLAHANLRFMVPNGQQHRCLDAELGAAPVATLGVVTDGVTGAHADPLGDGAVLRHLLGLRGNGR